MIRIAFASWGDRGEFTGETTIGYYPSKEEAMKALAGLCPWDFNPMGATSNYKDFIFHSYENSESRTAKMLAEARRHAIKMPGGCNRAPINWGE
jgi:hypothetical protein